MPLPAWICRISAGLICRCRSRPFGYLQHTKWVHHERCWAYATRQQLQAEAVWAYLLRRAEALRIAAFIFGPRGSSTSSKSQGLPRAFLAADNLSSGRCRTSGQRYGTATETANLPAQDLRTQEAERAQGASVLSVLLAKHDLPFASFWGVR